MTAIAALNACGPTAPPSEPAPPTVAVAIEPSRREHHSEPEEPTPASEVPPMKEGDIENGQDLLRARAEFRLGAEAFARGDYAVARQHFEKSYELSHKAALLYNLIRTAVLEGDPVGACVYYRALEQRAAQDPSLAAMLARTNDPC